MQVGSRTLSPPVFQRHLVARAHAKKKGRRLLLTSLSLTSMVDMFSLLVIFLLQAFSTAPELVTVSKGLVLPSAISGTELMDAPVLSVSGSEIYLDQKLVGSTEEVLRKPDALMLRLSELRENWVKAHPNEKFKGEMNIQAHQGTSSTVISRIMGLLPSQNFGSLQLIVVAGGEK